MKVLSLEPDDDMKWIYDPAHRDYNTPMAKDLRERRSRAIASAPQWMKDDARSNDLWRTLCSRGYLARSVRTGAELDDGG